jgi:hypothetical protein
MTSAAYALPSVENEIAAIGAESTDRAIGLIGPAQEQGGVRMVQHDALDAVGDQNGAGRPCIVSHDLGAGPFAD